MSEPPSAVIGANLEKKAKRYLEDPRLSEEQRAEMRRHDEEMMLLGRSVKTRIRYGKTFILLGQFLKGKPFQEATERDLKDWMGALIPRYKPSSVKIYMTAAKTFYKWLNDGEPPQILKWYTPKIIATKGTQELEAIIEKMVTREEYEALIKACNHPMHRALIAAAWDTGARAAELLTARIKDLDIASDHPSMVVGGGKRRVPLLESLPYLNQWLAAHSHRDDPEAPLWWGQRGAFSYQGLDSLLRDKSKQAKLKRKIHAHMFRHRRATEHAKAGVSPYVMNQAMGWVSGSKQWEVYHHLVADDVINGIRAAYGFEVKKRKTEKPKVAKCPRCQENNPPENIYCFRCGFPIGDKEAMRKEEIIEKTDDVQNQVAAVLARRPDILELIKEEIKKEKER